MRPQTLRHITAFSLLISLATILAGVAIGVLAVWGIVPHENGTAWRLLASDAIVFAGAVLTNLAVACYLKPGGPNY